MFTVRWLQDTFSGPDAALLKQATPLYYVSGAHEMVVHRKGFAKPILTSWKAQDIRGTGAIRGRFVEWLASRKTKRM